MLISALTLAVRAFSIQLPIMINYNVHSDGNGGYMIECFGKKSKLSEVESLNGIQKFTVHPDCIAIDFLYGTLWLTNTGMEWI